MAISDPRLGLIMGDLANWKFPSPLLRHEMLCTIPPLLFLRKFPVWH